MTAQSFFYISDPAVVALEVQKGSPVCLHLGIYEGVRHTHTHLLSNFTLTSLLNIWFTHFSTGIWRQVNVCVCANDGDKPGWSIFRYWPCFHCCLTKKCVHRKLLWNSWILTSRTRTCTICFSLLCGGMWKMWNAASVKKKKTGRSDLTAVSQQLQNRTVKTQPLSRPLHMLYFSTQKIIKNISIYYTYTK